MEDFDKSFDDAQDKLYNKALRFLSYRPRSEKEIRDKLTNRISRTGRKKVEKVDVRVVDLVVQKLKEQNFINDEEFAKWWIESRLRFKPISLRLIKMELVQKGINKDLIEKTIYDLRFKNYDLDNAKRLIEKRIERFRNLSRDEIYQKLGSYLARRGFDWETIKKSIDEVVCEGV